MEKIKWGILGTGNIANSFAEDFKFTKHGIITSVASRSHEKATAFAQKYHIQRAYGTYEDLFNDANVDVVYVATPHNAHFQNSFDALTSGKAVLCEKPITVNTDECRQLIQLAKNSGNYLMEAMWTYFLPSIIKVQKWIEDGKIGKVKYIRADFGFKANRETE